MNGKNLNAGAVSLISGIKNPISLAYDVMEKSEHVFLAGEGAIKFAKMNNFSIEPTAYFYDDFRHKQWLEIKDTDSFQLEGYPCPMGQITFTPPEIQKKEFKTFSKEISIS